MMRALFTTTLCLCATTAAAQGTLAIIDVNSPPTMIGLAGQVTKAMVEEAARQKLTVLSPTEISNRLGNKTYAELQSCNGQPACVASRLGGLKASRAVMGSLS